MKRSAAILLVIVTLYIVLMPDVGIVEPNTITRLLGGWLTYLKDSLSKVKFDWPRILSALLWLMLFTVGLHLFCRWFYRNIGVPPDTARRWKVRFTLLSVGMVVILFSAGTSAVGIAHQIAFMSSPKEKIYDYPIYYWEQHPESLHMMCRELLDRAREHHLAASQILQAETTVSTAFGYPHNRYDLAGIDGPDGIIAALIMYPRDPQELHKFGIAVARGADDWLESGKTPREVFAALSDSSARRPATQPATSPTRPQ